MAVLVAREGARQTGPATGFVAQVLLLAVLALTAGLGVAGWIVGLACAVTMATLLARALVRGPDHRFGPATWITLARGTLAVGVAALVADTVSHDPPVALVVTLSAVAVAMDSIDGPVARRTGTITALGSRFDGEVDAFLILALSVYVAPLVGAWVLVIGAARYVYGVGEWLLAWMQVPLPRRDWRKVVAAVQGIVLTVVAADVLPRTLAQLLTAGALALLAESFGRDLWWLWRRRHQAPAAARADPGPRARGPLRTAVAVGLTVLAVLVVWVALVAPHQPGHFTVGAFARIPVELLVVVALAVLLPATGRRVLAVVVGGLLGLLVLVKALDVGMYSVFDRPFNPFDDWTHRGTAIETLRDSFGKSHADLVLVIAIGAIVALFVVLVASLLRLTRVAAGHRHRALQGVAVLAVVWAVLRVLGAPAASTSAVVLAVDQVQAVQAGLQDREVVARLIARDDLRATPANRLLTGLRGKDVLLVFVEAYGRVAIQDSPIAPRIDAVLDRGEDQLGEAGFSARSGFLKSPTFGGISWLAHATMQSGIWINSQRRYNQVTRSRRFTLSRAFKRAGWRTVGDLPINDRDWPEGSRFYRFDQIYDSRNVGYRGPRYGYPTMPDQYVLLALQRLELAKRHQPLFAEVDLISSHLPWTRIPRFIPWEDVGDGSVFHDVPTLRTSRSAVLNDADKARAAYSASIDYSLSTLFSFVQRYGDKDLVLVVLGDHQPASVVSGRGVGHDVPISVIAHDPKVLDRVAGWGWTPGLRPDPKAPVWRMNAFRDRFLTTFGSAPAGG